ncbi:structural maintenance of chromosomes 2 [Actinidia rufa]|uniref:Structural maintenance of chromosomes 2 n=1 Tax=Actinidia rufa TaxID=165716 RepID=A0A7J0GWH1_9ERIC|nr:structural maintenance of chromosomes 2 [Actinidia rufa]
MPSSSSLQTLAPKPPPVTTLAPTINSSLATDSASSYTSTAATPPSDPSLPLTPPSASLPIFNLPQNLTLLYAHAHDHTTTPPSMPLHFPPSGINSPFCTPFSSFIVVSLKEGMFNNANVLFRTKFVDGVSTVQRTVASKLNK